MSERAQLQKLEEEAEAAYSRMYDAPPRGAKADYEDASRFLYLAIEEAKRLGLEGEADRLARRKEHIRKVFDSQFRWW